MVKFHLDIKDFFTFPETKKSRNDPNVKMFFDAKKNPHRVEFHHPDQSSRCWHDHHPLTLEGDLPNPGYPLPINQKDGVGWFCSYECMLGYANMETRPLLRSATSLVTENFLRDNPSKDVSELKQAPPFEVLIDYGGSLSIREYRENFHRPKKTNIFSVLSQGMEVPP